MKRYIIPAIFVVDANSSEEANHISDAMRKAIPSSKFQICLLDEELPNKVTEIDYELSYIEAPHSYTDKSLTFVSK